MNRVCPYCGKEIHEQSGFCPHCTQSLNKRAAASPPRAVPRRAVGVGIAVLLCAALVLGLNGWLCSQPQTYESDTGEALYSGYRLCLSSEEPPVPVPQNGYHAMLDYPYRYPVPLYVTPEDGDELLTDEFMENVEFVTAGIDCSDIYMSISCTEPQQHNEYFPNAAAVTFVDFSLVAPGVHEAELTWSITMKNGDVIRMRQAQRHTSISVYQYTAADTDMGTIEELQSLVDRVSAEIDEYDQLKIYLPAVEYAGGLRLERSVFLYGSIGPDGQRTTFTGPTEISGTRGVPEFTDISFRGSGQGVGVRADGTTRLHLTGCRVSGWETGFLALDSAWINADETVFEGNEVGMCFDAEDTPMVSDDFYTNNTFRDNGTAVLLLSVSNDTSLKFPGTLFTGNDVDIDNLCAHPLDLSEAAFDENIQGDKR